MRLMIVTGDYHHTAIAVARGVGMVPPHERVVIIQTLAEHTGTLNQTPSLDTAQQASVKPSRKVAIGRGVSFAVDVLSPAEASESSVWPIQSPYKAESPTSHSDPDGLVQSPGHAWQSPGGALTSPNRPPTSLEQLLQSQDEVSLSARRSSASRRQLLLSPKGSAQSPGRASSFQRLPLLTSRASLAMLANSLSVQHDFSECKFPDSSSEGLAFCMDNGDAFEDGDALRALSSISQVLPCLCFVIPSPETLTNNVHATNPQHKKLNCMCAQSLVGCVG